MLEEKAFRVFAIGNGYYIDRIYTGAKTIREVVQKFAEDESILMDENLGQFRLFISIL